MSQQLSDPDAPSLMRPGLRVSSQQTPAAPQQPQGPPDSFYNSLYAHTAYDVFVDLPDSSLVPASFGAHSLRTANAIGTQAGLGSINPRPATDADTLRNMDLNAQLRSGPPKSDLSSNVLPVPSPLAEAAGVTGPASGLPPRRANVEYGMLPLQNTPLIPITHIPPQPSQAPVPTLTALPMAQSNLPASTIQSSAGSGPLTPMPQSPVVPGAQPPLSQQQILQLITSQSPSQSPVAAAQLAQLLQSPNAQPILTQLAAMMGSAQAAPAPTQTQEEISTIFMVGFPDDMTEREFQNMFTFCPGYEAATLKMPAKDTPSFPNGQSSTGSGLRGVFPASGVSPRQAAALAAANAVSNAIAGASDPYNLVTVNSGGVVVDQGNNQTATTSSAWSTGLDDMYTRSLIATSIAASNASTSTTDFGVAGGSNTGGSNLQSRKQIIGFAKFRTRQEALEARDVLHGRRVDIEKGSVLKAEMAKKNLHTKRGVGSLQGPSTATNATNANNINGLAASGMLAPENHALGPAASVSNSTGLTNAMDSPLSSGAPGYSALATSRVNDTDPFKVTHPVVNPVPTFQPLGPGATLNSNNGLPPHDPSVILPRDLLYSPGRPEPSNAWTLNDPSLVSAQNEQPTLHSGPGEPYARHRSGQLDRKMGVLSPPSMGPSSLPPRPASSVNSSSPRTTSCASNDTEVGAGYNSDYSTRSFSPNESMANSLVGGIQPPDSNMDAMSRVMQIMQGASKMHLGDPTLIDSSLPSVGKQVQAFSSHGGESVRTSSDSSTGSRRNNTADQNPPINTLYVGNLPSSQAPQSKYLEEALLTLFSRCPGYRKLCFRQKTNGPMCFVEFDDVPSATRALKEQYGNTLNGLVKGGIRLSYSKNPLGVRTAVPNGPSQPPSLVGSPLGSPTTQIPQVPLQFGMNTAMGSLHDVPLHSRGGLAIPGADLPSRLRNDEHPAAFASSPPNRLLASPPPISSGGGAFAAITSRSHTRAPISIASPNNSSIHQSFSFMPATSPPTAGPLYPGSTFQPFGSTEQTSQGQWPQFP